MGQEEDRPTLARRWQLSQCLVTCAGHEHTSLGHETRVGSLSSHVSTMAQRLKKQGQCFVSLVQAIQK